MCKASQFLLWHGTVNSPVMSSYKTLEFLTIGEDAVFTVFGKITGDILAEVTGITVGLFAAVERTS